MARNAGPAACPCDKRAQGLNAVLGWWWADPVAVLAIAAVALREGVETWRAESLADTCCD